MAAKAKKLATNYPVPQSDAELDSHILALGMARRELSRREADMNDALAKLKLGHEQAAEDLKARARALLLGIETYCTAHRDRLTQGGKVKFAAFPSGRVNWRLRPPRVSIRAQEAALEALRALGLSRFIRVKEEVNKEALLAEPEVAAQVKGVSIGSEGEDFVVEPFEEELAKGGDA